MITEDYVSFETAKLLKEKGFNGVVKTWYNYHSKSYVCKGKDVTEYHHSPLIFAEYGLDVNHDESYDSCISAPTLQMAMKWLREAHDIHIGILVTYQHIPRKYEVHIMKIEEINDIVLCPIKDFDTYEEACEAAIKYCLTNLI